MVSDDNKNKSNIDTGNNNYKDDKEFADILTNEELTKILSADLGDDGDGSTNNDVDINDLENLGSPASTTGTDNNTNTSNSDNSLVTIDTADADTDTTVVDLTNVDKADKDEEGSGNIDEDLNNWFNNTSSIPSSPLKSYVSNSIMKMNYGISRNTLSNYEMMSKLRTYIMEIIPYAFKLNEISTLSPEEIAKYLAMSFAMYKELYNMNQRTYLTLLAQKNKYDNSEEGIDKLTMLLSSIPSDKLEKAFNSLIRGGNNNTNKDNTNKDTNTDHN